MFRYREAKENLHRQSLSPIRQTMGDRGEAVMLYRRQRQLLAIPRTNRPKGTATNKSLIAAQRAWEMAWVNTDILLLCISII